jgi:hypothetical protein
MIFLRTGELEEVLADDFMKISLGKERHEQDSRSDGER